MKAGNDKHNLLGDLLKKKKALDKWKRLVTMLSVLVLVLTSVYFISPARAVSESDHVVQEEVTGDKTQSAKAEAKEEKEKTAEASKAEEKQEKAEKKAEEKAEEKSVKEEPAKSEEAEASKEEEGKAVKETKAEQTEKAEKTEADKKEEEVKTKETEKTEKAAAAKESESEAEEFASGKLTAKTDDKNATITVKYDENAQIPDGAELVIEPVSEKKSESFLKASKKALKLKDTKETKVKGQFYKVTIEKDGETVCPKADLDAEISLKDETTVQAVKEAKKDEQRAELISFGESKVKEENAEVLDTDMTVTAKANAAKVSFQMPAQEEEEDTSATLGIVYTVDYTLGEYTYSMPGDSSIKLSELMSKLRIKDFDASKVKNVAFTDESLVKVKKDKDGDWTLTSLKPFKSSEKLTIEMTDGVYEIDVKDAQDFGQYVTGISVAKNTKEDGTGTWIPVTDNTLTNNDYGRITIDFEIPQNFVSDDNTLTMKYTGADVFVPEGGTSGTAFLDGKPAGTYSISKDGTITVTIDPDIIDSTKPFKGEISFEGTAHNTSETEDKTVTFNDKNIITVKPSEKPKDYDMTVQKTSGTPVEENGTKYIYYTVKVSTEKGTKGGNISLSDKLSGNGIGAEYDFGKQFTIVKHSANGNESTVSASTPRKNSDGSYNFGSLPELAAGEYYTIQYAVKVGTDITSADGYSNVSNTFTAKDSKETKTGDNTVQITAQFLQKTVQTDPNDPTKLLWTVTINSGKQKLTSDVTIKDVITTSDGEKISLPKNFTYTTNGGNQQQGTFGEDGSFTFWESNGTNNTYVVTYSTDAPKPAEGESATITNTVTDNKDHKGTASTSVTTPVTSYDLEKKLTEKKELEGTKEELTWNSTIALPKSSEVDPSKIQYTDTFTTMNSSQSVEGKHYSTGKKLSESLQITYTDKSDGSTKTLVAGTDYKLYTADGKALDTTDDTTEITGFMVKFRDTDTVKNAGANAKDGLHISYKSIADYDEVNPGETWNFINSAKIPSHETTSQWDYKKPSGSLDKESSGSGKASDNDKENTYWSNGVKLNYEAGKDNIIYYRVFITPDWSKGGEITLNDVLPAGVTLLSGTDSNNNNRNYNRIEYFENNTQYYDLNQYSKKYSFTTGDKNEDGTTPLTIKINDGWQNGGRNTGKLVIYYAVKIDDEYWNDSTHTTKLYKNTITWGQLHDTQTTEVDHNEKVLVKTGEQEYLKDGLVDYKGKDGKKVTSAVNYYIDINPQGLDLIKESDVLHLTDKMVTDQNDSKVMIDPTSIKLYTYDENNKDNHHLGTEISSDRYTFNYDDATDSLTMTIPDGLACVLTYKYNVSMGLNAPILTNSVSIEGRSQDSTKHEEHTETSSSYSNLYQKVLTVKKVDSENNSMGLPNVTFQLDKFNKTTKQWEKVSDQKKTGEDGTIKLDSHSGIADFPGENVLYRIQEINNPDTRYQLNDDYHYFLWKTKASQSDGDAYTAALPKNESQYNHPSIKDLNVNQIQFLVGNGSVFVPNENVTVNVHKIWVDENGGEITDKSKLTATVQLRRHSGQIEKCIVKVQTSKDNNTEVWGTYEVKPGSTMYITAQTNNPGVTFTYDGNSYTSKRINPDQTLSSVTIPVTVTGNMLIDLSRNGDYNSGSQNVSYTRPDTFNEIKDESVGKAVELNAENNWTYSWDRDLPKKDADGNEYYYYIEELSSGNKYDVTYSENNSFGIQQGTITVTNREKPKPPTTDFTFTKKWFDANSQSVNDWPAGKSIALTLTGTTEGGTETVTYKFTITDGTPSVTSKPDDSDVTIDRSADGFTYKISGLPGDYTYTMKEDTVEGYKDPEYADSNGKSLSDPSNGISDGQVINNKPEESYNLPSTGGSGTNGYMRGGILLLAAAALLYIYSRRRQLMAVGSEADGNCKMPEGHLADKGQPAGRRKVRGRRGKRE